MESVDIFRAFSLWAQREWSIFPFCSRLAKIGVSKSTLQYWFRQGMVEDVGRDARGWRVFSEADIRRLRAFHDRLRVRGCLRKGATVGWNPEATEEARKNVRAQLAEFLK